MTGEIVSSAGPTMGAGARGWVHRIGVIWRLEAEQMVRPASLVWAAGLAALPAALLATLRVLAPPSVETEGVLDLWLYILVPILLCPLGLILTATSAIHSEIENRTWVYLALRPRARVAALAGKYLFAVTWVLAIAAAAIGLTAVVLWGLVSPGTVVRVFGVSILASFAYGALYLLAGVAFLRVGMVIAIAYTVIVEVVLGNLPSLLNRITISHHLRSVYVRALPEGTIPDEVTGPFFQDAGPLALHLVILVAMAIGFFAAAAVLLRMREIAVGEAE